MISRGRRWWEVGVALLFVSSSVVQFLPQIGEASCVSSCGKISNISYPFRLKGDPDHCGDKRYELECIEDDDVVVLVLRLFSAELYVKSINYNNFTIRLVDPNLYDSSHCSSLPRYFLYRYNFSDPDTSDTTEIVDDRFRAYQLQGENYFQLLFGNVIYIKCESETPVSDDYYLNTTSCLDPHIYAIPGDIKLGSLKTGCHGIATTPWNESVINWTLPHDYEDVYREGLVFGFEVSWLHSVCVGPLPVTSTTSLVKLDASPIHSPTTVIMCTLPPNNAGD